MSGERRVRIALHFDKGIIIQSITEDDTVVMDANTGFPTSLGSNSNKIILEAAASLSQEKRRMRRRRILVGFDIYCAAATCGLVSWVKTGGNSGGFLQRDTTTNNLNISHCKT